MLTAYRLDFIEEGVGDTGVFIPAEYYLVEELKEYPDLEVHIITISHEIKIDKKIEKDKLTIHYLSSPRLPRIITGLTIDQYKIIKKIRELKPDIIHAQMTAPVYGFTASLVSKNIPTVLTVHGVVREEAKSWGGTIGYLKRVIFGLMEMYTLKKIKTITVGTQYVEEKIKHISKAKIHVIPVVMGEDYLKVENNEKKNRLLFVGGIEPRKGLINLLKTIKIIKGTIPTIDLHIVGKIRKQDYFSELQEYLQKNGLEQNVKFTGFLSQNDLKKEYGECSVFVLPSFEESQGVVLLEAMAASKPVVASNIAGIPYVVDDNKTGFLAEYGNSEDFAEKILLLLKNESLRREFGKMGRTKAGDYTAKSVAYRVYEVYRQVYKNENRDNN